MHLWQVSVHQPFFFFASFSLLFPCKEDNYEVALVFIFYCPYEITTKDDDDYNVHCHLLFFFYETKAKDNNECASSLSFIFSCIAEDNDEPPHSSSSSAIIREKKHKNP